MSRLRGRCLAGSRGTDARARGTGRALALLAVLALWPAPPAPAATGRWSEPAVLTPCPSAAQPRVVFPSADPHTSSGPGAILWSGEPCRADGPPGAGVGLAPLGADDLPGPAQALAAAGTLGRLAATAGTGDGRIFIAAAVVGQPGATAVVEGRTGAPFGRPVALATRSAPLASATSYLGDLALVTVNPGSRVELRLQRHGAPGFSRPVRIAPRPGPVSAVAVGLDYRGDALVVWAQGGWISGRVLRASGRLEPARRIAPSPPAPHLQALISDDDHGIAAWTSDVSTGGATTTRLYLDASGRHVRFGRPVLVEQFQDPPGMVLPEGSMRLVRRASEDVMMAWTDVSAGRYVVRAAAVSLSGLHPATLVSGPGDDSVLDDLATGPHGEVLALWTTAPRAATGGGAPGGQLMAARGVTDPPGVAAFSRPELVSGAGPIATPRAAVDPASGTAVAVWQRLGASPGIAYATRRAAAALGRSAPATHATGGPGGFGASGWAVVSALLLLAAGGLSRMRRARRPRRSVSVGRPPEDQPHPLGRLTRRPNR